MSDLKELNQITPRFITQELNRNQCIRGRPQKLFESGGQRRNFAYPFQIADDAMQMDVHKRFTLSTHYCSLYWLNLNSQSFV